MNNIENNLVTISGILRDSKIERYYICCDDRPCYEVIASKFVFVLEKDSNEKWLKNSPFENQKISVSLETEKFNNQIEFCPHDLDSETLKDCYLEDYLLHCGKGTHMVLMCSMWYSEFDHKWEFQAKKILSIERIYTKYACDNSTENYEEQEFLNEIDQRDRENFEMYTKLNRFVDDQQQHHHKLRMKLRKLLLSNRN